MQGWGPWTLNLINTGVLDQRSLEFTKLFVTKIHNSNLLFHSIVLAGTFYKMSFYSLETSGETFLKKLRLFCFSSKLLLRTITHKIVNKLC